VTDHLARLVLPVFMFVLTAGVLVPAPRADAQTPTTLYNFCTPFRGVQCPDGASPMGGLLQATNGDLYGITEFGGTYMGGDEGGGTVFKITPDGTLTTLYRFCAQTGCPDGQWPITALMQATNGDLYGTTEFGGTYNSGTVFKITPTGALTTLYSFCAQSGCPDGDDPETSLVQAANGDLYGTTRFGGVGSTCDSGCGYGTIFKITPTDALTTLYSCNESPCPEGTIPTDLVASATGAVFGTMSGGVLGGTVFEITPSGPTTLYIFCNPGGCQPGDGKSPYDLLAGADGDLYGLSEGGVYGGGTVFRIAPSGTFYTLHEFCLQNGCPDGRYPVSLIQATDGNLYGTTESNTIGDLEKVPATIFKITPNGELTTLYTFCINGCTRGDYQYAAGLIQDTNGDIYGITEQADGGSIFALAIGLGPFVKALPTFGNAGTVIAILGTDLTGATSVTFNGTAATFTVASPTAIRSTVPTGATTGTIAVTTPSGTLLSNVAFRVAQ
jgi:uncharacterized repeat protein (TIGR03803 family)